MYNCESTPKTSRPTLTTGRINPKIKDEYAMPSFSNTYTCKKNTTANLNCELHLKG